MTKSDLYKAAGLLFFILTLIVPVHSDARNYFQQKSKSASEPVYHTVKKGETLFRISKKYHVTPGEIVKWNKLSGNNIGAGQKLVVGYLKKKKEDSGTDKKSKQPLIIKHPPRNIKAKPLPPEKIVSPKVNYEKKPVWNDSLMKDISEEGLASWIDDNSEGKYYALHRTASVGTIIRVTNKENQKSVYVKVLGKIPAKEELNAILIQISKAASEKLEVTESRFNATLNYSAPE
jgi:hypothetical protein